MPTKYLSKAALAVEQDVAQFDRGFNMRDKLQPVKGNGRVFEFIGNDTFGAEWVTRQRFEIDAGRDMEPILYTPFYNTINDPNLPKIIDTFKLGPGGVVLESITEGGEVQFGTVLSSNEAVRLAHYGVGLEYSDDLVAYNQLWSVSIFERQVGIAYNALLNHVHLYPILSYTYGAANQQAAVTSGTTLEDDYMLTLEAAITKSRTDTANPRRGPYALLVSPQNLFAFERAMFRVPQEGFTRQTSAIDVIQAVVAYDGWTGTRGNLTTTYPGVTTNKAYLVDLSNKMLDFQSYMKQGLEEYGREEDISRFMLQVVWDTRFGCYANPLRAVTEITLPT